MTSTHVDGESAAAAWFGPAFGQLHPLLQALHRGNGRLGGTVSLQFGTGLAGVLGRRMARRMGVPDVPGPHHLDVSIDHDTNAMAWRRVFGHAHLVTSRFIPRGRWPDGYWIERTGPLEVHLAVDIDDGAWRWRVASIRLWGVRVPRWLAARAIAFKCVEDERYRFFVGCALPLLGEVFSYSGLLDARPHGGP